MESNPTITSFFPEYLPPRSFASIPVLHPVADLGGAGGPWRGEGEMVSAQYLRGARRGGGESFGR